MYMFHSKSFRISRYFRKTSFSVEVKINDDDELNSILNEVEVSNTVSMPRKTPKLKKKKKMAMSVGGMTTAESVYQTKESNGQKKRVMKDGVEHFLL